MSTPPTDGCEMAQISESEVQTALAPPALEESFLQSNSLEALLARNDELTARLNINARKNIHLEQLLGEKSSELNELKRKVETLSEQILIYREKDQAVKKRHQGLEHKFQDIVNELESQQIRYSELYSDFKNLGLEKEQQLQELQNKLDLLIRYRHRLREDFYPAYRQQAQEVFELKQAMKELYLCINESGEQIKRQKEQMERQKSEFSQRAQDTATEVKNLQDFRDKYLLLKEERTVHQNRVIAAERQRDEVQEKYRSEIKDLQQKMSDFRCQTKQVRLTNQDLNQRLRQLEEEHADLTAHNQRLSDQNESLQLLWQENHKKMQQAASREEALQKLNQELSQKLKQGREETHQLKVTLEESRQSSLQEVKKLKTERGLISTPQESEDGDLPTAVVEKLENLLAEIQSGYSSTTAPSVSLQLPHHDFTQSPEKKSKSAAGELMSEQGDLL